MIGGLFSNHKEESGWQGGCTSPALVVTGHSVRVHAELAVVHDSLVQAGLQPLHHRGCRCQTEQTLRGELGKKKNDELNFTCTLGCTGRRGGSTSQPHLFSHARSQQHVNALLDGRRNFSVALSEVRHQRLPVDLLAGGAQRRTCTMRRQNRGKRSARRQAQAQ